MNRDTFILLLVLALLLAARSYVRHRAAGKPRIF
jgi:hypothetical protein